MTGFSRERFDWNSKKYTHIFLKPVFTGDESRVFCLYPETKRQVSREKFVTTEKIAISIIKNYDHANCFFYFQGIVNKKCVSPRSAGIAKIYKKPVKCLHPLGPFCEKIGLISYCCTTMPQRYIAALAIRFLFRNTISILVQHPRSWDWKSSRLFPELETEHERDHFATEKRFKDVPETCFSRAMEKQDDRVQRNGY